MRFLLGGYTPDKGGIAEGIGVLLSGAPDEPSAGAPLAFAGPAGRPREGVDDAWYRSPSWIAAHPRLDVVYAALEGEGRLGAYRRVGEDALEPLGDTVEAGEAVCHVAVAPGGGYLVASCWGDGRVVHVGLDAEGRMLSPVLTPEASDPYDAGSDRYGAGSAGGGAGSPAGGGAGVAVRPAPDLDLAAAARALREAAGDEYAHLVPDVPGTQTPAPVEPEPERVSRAHEAVFLPDGRIATTDLGYDVVRIWAPGAHGLRPDHEVVLPRGSGPRHMLVHPSGHVHVLSELSCEVFVLSPGEAGRWRLVGGVPTGAPVEGDTAAELTASPDGVFLHAGIRGSNTISVLRVRGAGERLEPVALVDSGVDNPRHQLVVRDTLLVAGRRSNDVVSLTLDERTGVPGRVRHRAPAPSPTCILPIR